jgi:tellurite resistance protein TerB
MAFLSSLMNDFQDHLERRKNRPFLSASMGVCALVAASDGEISFAERVRVDQILGTLKQLQVFDPHEGIDIFNAFTDDILADPRDGRARTWEAIMAGAPDAEARDLLIRMCLAISEANAETSLTDQIEIVSICGHLGVDPHNLGLYVDDPAFQAGA